jgi:DNA-binding protein H-NS
VPTIWGTRSCDEAATLANCSLFRRKCLNKPLNVEAPYDTGIRALTMKPHDIESMSVDELWSLHEFVASVLARKISVQKARLDEQLRLLDAGGVPENAKEMSRARRPYPQVFPKYRNPTVPSETWSGRGKQPRWLTAQLRSGKKLDDFRIQPSSNRGAALRKVFTIINKKVQPKVISVFGF